MLNSATYSAAYLEADQIRSAIYRLIQQWISNISLKSWPYHPVTSFADPLIVAKFNKYFLLLPHTKFQAKLPDTYLRQAAHLTSCEGTHLCGSV